MTEKEHGSVAMGDSEFEAPQKFYVRWALGDDGSLRIRKWSQFPFDGANEYAAALSSRPAQEPVAWESTTTCYIKYVTDSRFRSFSDAAKRWYKPYKCSSCAPQPAHGTSATERVPAENVVAWMYEKNGKVIVNTHNQPWQANNGWKITPLGPIHGTPSSALCPLAGMPDPAKRFSQWIEDGPKLAKAAGCYVGIKVSAALATPTPKEESK